MTGKKKASSDPQMSPTPDLKLHILHTKCAEHKFLRLIFRSLSSFRAFHQRVPAGLSLGRPQRMPEEEGPPDLHQVPDTRAGKGVSFQPLFDTEKED